jgi:hypothetical protein
LFGQAFTPSVLVIPHKVAMKKEDCFYNSVYRDSAERKSASGMSMDQRYYDHKLLDKTCAIFLEFQLWHNSV